MRSPIALPAGVPARVPYIFPIIIRKVPTLGTCLGALHALLPDAALPACSLRMYPLPNFADWHLGKTFSNSHHAVG